MSQKKISSALISVFDKTGLAPIIHKLNKMGVTFYSTGGTEIFIRDLGYDVVAVEDVTGYPSILGGRVKTLHPKIFGGILNRQEEPKDIEALEAYEIPQIDLVIVDLYPFEDTVATGASEEEIVEKIDIGGIALIRAAAKNYKDVICVSDKNDYDEFLNLITTKDGSPELSDRKYFSAKAFQTSSHYDSAIFNYFNEEKTVLKLSIKESKRLRYGENPHQEGYFFGPLGDLLEQVHGKEISYNNLLDIDAAVNLIVEFYDEDPTFAILKHNNACGFAQRKTLKQAYVDALAGDPVSAFGGVLISNKEIDAETAEALLQLRNAGCELLNQAVLLRSVNDDAESLIALSERLSEVQVLPYYLHLLDKVKGASHFDVAEQQGIELIAAMRRELPGYLVPRLVREQQGETSKTIIA